MTTEKNYIFKETLKEILQNSGKSKSHSDRPQYHLMHRFWETLKHLGEFVESSGELKSHTTSVKTIWEEHLDVVDIVLEKLHEILKN